MGGYIRMDKDLEDDPRVADLAEALENHLKSLTREQLLEYLPRLTCNAVLGGLYRLWRYGDTHLGRHNRLKGALHGLARISDVTALPVEVLQLFPPEWLKEHTDGSVELPDYAAKNNLINRDIRREQNRDRVRNFRRRKREQADSGNALQGITEKPLHHYKTVTTGPGPDPVPGPNPPKPGPGPEPALGSLACVAEAPRSPSGDASEDRTRTGGNGMRFAITATQLESMAKALASKGRDQFTIAATLKPYGATEDQVSQWLNGSPA